MEDVLRHRQSKKDALHNLERAIQNYAKRQMTWFRKNPDIHWIEKENEALRLARDFLTKPVSLLSRHSSDSA